MEKKQSGVSAIPDYPRLLSWYGNKKRGYLAINGGLGLIAALALFAGSRDVPVFFIPAIAVIMSLSHEGFLHKLQSATMQYMDPIPDQSRRLEIINRLIIATRCGNLSPWAFRIIFYSQMVLWSFFSISYYLRWWLVVPSLAIVLILAMTLIAFWADTKRRAGV